MTKRDPFPMSSPQAVQLEASVPTTTASSAWTHMTSTANTAAAAASSAAPDAASASLTGSARKKNVDDIYADVDTDDNNTAEDEFLDRPLWESHRGARWKARAVRAGEAI